MKPTPAITKQVENTQVLTAELQQNTHPQFLRSRIVSFISQNEALIGLIVICMILSFSTKFFMTVSNIVNVLQEISVIGVIAVGMTLVIICGEIDLSVGSVTALSGTILGLLFAKYHVPIGMAILIGIAAGVVIGFLTGLISINLSIPSFIVTLASMSLVRGLAFIISNGFPLTVTSPFLKTIGQKETIGIPNTVIILVVIIIAGYYLLEKARFGCFVLAVGGNKEAARIAGIPVTKIRLAVFTISGMLAGLSGVMLAGQFGSGSPNAGTDFELDAIAAVVLGGTDLYGGKGRMFGTVIGMLIIGVINNGMNLMNISPYYQMVVKGLVILLALSLNRFKRIKRKGKD